MDEEIKIKCKCTTEMAFTKIELTDLKNSGLIYVYCPICRNKINLTEMK